MYSSNTVSSRNANSKVSILENVWNYINYSKKRQEELSLMITDFEYSPKRQYIKHPKNLFYSPVKTSDYEYILECANEFIESMKSKAPHIRSKMFM